MNLVKNGTKTQINPDFLSTTKIEEREEKWGKEYLPPARIEPWITRSTTYNALSTDFTFFAVVLFGELCQTQNYISIKGNVLTFL